MYSRLAHSKERAAWRESYQRGFGGVSNVLSHAERLGSPELRAAAQKARKGSKAEQVAFVRMLEKEGGVVEGLRVTDELSQTLGESFGDYEEDIEGIRGRRAAAYGGLEEATTKRAKGGLRGFAAKVAGSFFGVAGDVVGLNKAAADWVGTTQSGISGADMERFLSEDSTREDYIKMMTGSAEEKREAIANLEAAAGEGGTMDEGRKETFRRLRDLQKSGTKKGKQAMLAVAQSFNAEDYRARIEVESDLGKQLQGAMESASTVSMGESGRAAWKTLQKVADLRASSDPEKIAQSYELEAQLMEDITGTQAGKDIRKALRGKEGGEFVLAGLEGAAGYFSRFGGGKRGKRMSNQAKISNIMQAMLSTEGLSLSDTVMLEAFDVSRSKDILKILSKGGEQSQQAIEKILTTAQEGGMSESRLGALRKRLTDVGAAIGDKKITEEEARSLAGGLGGRIAGAARAKSDAAKVATADGQEKANKYLNSIAAATQLLAGGQKIDLSPESIAALKKAVGGPKKAGSG
jgi:hypothetical protein